jgi:glycosyltransferase involved in cell wall biosynthesis
MDSFPTEIVYFAVNRWDSMVQREQHLMMGLSRTYRVLFVDPPLSFLTILSGKTQGKKWTFRSHLYWVNDQLVVYTPPAFPPFSQYFQWMSSFHTSLLISLTKRMLKKLSFQNFIVGIARPFLSPVIKELSPKLSYYDCMDDYLEFPGWRADKEMLKRFEEELLKSVDLVFCSSQGLKEAKSMFNRNCFLLPNGVDLNLFSDNYSDVEIPPDIKRVKRPIIGYIGTIGERLDFNALISLARARPDWSIVMIGPLTAKRFSSIMTGAPNIYWLGEKGYKELSRYLKIFDVCLIPFEVNEFTKKIYPTKLHQYLAAGKPVVSSQLPDLEPFAPWVEFYSDAKEMVMKIERSLQEDSMEKVLKREKVASENTWDRRVESMVHTFNTFLSERIPSQ